MCLTIGMLSKHTGTLTKLDWDWFFELNWDLFENVQEHEIFQNLFFSSEMLGLRFIFCSKDFK